MTTGLLIAAMIPAPAVMILAAAPMIPALAVMTPAPPVDTAAAATEAGLRVEVAKVELAKAAVRSVVAEPECAAMTLVQQEAAAPEPQLAASSGHRFRP